MCVCAYVAEKHELFVFFPLHSVTLLANGSLLIRQVKTKNTGTYKCVGRGLGGSQVTLEASILIAGTHTFTLYSNSCSFKHCHCNSV